MKRRLSQIAILICLIGLVCLAALGSAATNPVYAIRNARIVTVTGPVIPNGTIIIRDGKIADVGANVGAPSGARVIDARGLSVYPGLIDSGTALGLTEIGSVAGTQDTTEIGQINPHIRTAVAINPHSELIPVTRVNGITTVLSAPRGGLISGQSALINLAGWTPQEMVLKSPVAVHINYPSSTPRFGFGGPPPDEQQQPGEAGRSEAAARQLNELRKVFRDAQEYARMWDAYSRNRQGGEPKIDLVLQSLVPVVKGELPVIISADTEADIKGAISFAEEMKLKFILSGVADGWKVASLLKSKNVPVIVGSIHSLPRRADDPYDSIFANPGILNKAGVKIAIQTGDAANVRNLPYEVAMAAAFGLPREEALKAITIYPAEILGVSDKVGSIEKGKIANLFIADGDPLEVPTQVKYLFINGKQIDLKNRHSDLYEKFLNRP